jgi:hypothetical protein|eukprot:COSAG02_NODE_1193_length_13958_cov_4.939029_7_plen_116_part_00
MYGARWLNSRTYSGHYNYSAFLYVFLPVSLCHTYIDRSRYWGLQNYRHVPEADTGRRALCSQMRMMMLEQWRNNGYICENYFPAKGHNGCSPGAMHFYHWGALSGFISLLDAGFY